ncbi:MAG: LysR family transcriptional regulator [Lachnospiraceae bacterium]|jgi:LysR family cyn operon transcriptional activator
MNIQKYKILLSVEDTGSISRTADLFYISPSAVSQCIKKEEKCLNIPIFRYENHRMTPTPEGTLYLQFARKMINICQGTTERIRGLKKSDSTVTLTVVPVQRDLTEAQIVPLIREHFPDIQVDLIEAKSKIGEAYLVNGIADLGLIALPMINKASLGGEKVGEDVLMFLVPKSYLRNRQHEYPTLQDCRTVPIILLKKGTYIRDYQDKVLAQNGLSDCRTYEADDYFSARDYLDEGRGAAFLPSTLLPENASRHFFVIPLVPDERMSYFLLYEKTKIQDPKVKQIYDFLLPIVKEKMPHM